MYVKGGNGICEKHGLKNYPVVRPNDLTHITTEEMHRQAIERTHVLVSKTLGVL